MCLYQIESLLSRPSPKRLSMAELHHPLLLKVKHIHQLDMHTPQLTGLDDS